jgi:glyceraldehyde 3-phosphate dehydrogenase
MSKKVIINGMGYMGRVIAREIIDNPDKYNMDIVGINDAHVVDAIAYLLKYDTAYGTWKADILPGTDNDILEINGVRIPVGHYPTIDGLIDFIDKEAYGDVLIECSGTMTATELLSLQNSGLKYIVACYPVLGNSIGGDFVPIISFGVNHTNYANEKIVCMASPDVQILTNILKPLPVDYYMAYSSRSNSNSQSVNDNYATPAQFGRAANYNISPTKSVNAKSVDYILPGLDAKGILVENRALTIVGGVVNIAAVLNGVITQDSIIDTLRAENPLDIHNENVYYISPHPLVSSDAINQSYAGIILQRLVYAKDLGGETYISISAIYDNYYGQAVQTLRELDYLTQNY